MHVVEGGKLSERGSLKSAIVLLVLLLQCLLASKVTLSKLCNCQTSLTREPEGKKVGEEL